MRLTAGRGWIAVLCALLGGIVALNVISLSINATSGRVSQAVEEYERQNSALRAELAEELSAGRVEDAAAYLGLAVPAPEDVTYLTARDDDFDKLAGLLADDSLLTGDDWVPSASTGSASYGESYAPPLAPTSTAPSTSTPAPPAQAPSEPAASGGGTSTSGGVGL